MGIFIGQPMPAKAQVTHRVITVTDSEVKITLATNAQHMIVENIGTAICYIGTSGVTDTEFGFWMTPKDRHDFGYVHSGFNFYAIMGNAATSTLGVVEDA